MSEETNIAPAAEAPAPAAAPEAAAAPAKAARNNRKTRRGTVLKKSGDKSIVVLVERRYQHPVYGKQLVDAKKYHTHDERNEAAPGDFVVIQETRPLSKLKRWRLVKIVKSAAAAEKKAEEAAQAVIAAEEAAAEGK